jgi:hypothetical protein
MDTPQNAEQGWGDSKTRSNFDWASWFAASSRDVVLAEAQLWNVPQTDFDRMTDLETGGGVLHSQDLTEFWT